VTNDNAFLSVRDLRVHFPTDDGLVKSVDGLSFDLERGKTACTRAVRPGSPARCGWTDRT
jgi:ABC-type microcin C transport system duplicated ATPase subunit YejF